MLITSSKHTPSYAREGFQHTFKKLSFLEFSEIRNGALRFEYQAMQRVIYLMKRVLKEEKMEIWLELFQMLDLKDESIKEFYLKGYFMNQMSDIIRNRHFSEKEIRKVTQNDLLTNYIFESFVDYKSLHFGGYYQKMALELNPTNLEQESFKKSLLLMEQYLNGNLKEVRKWSEALSRYPTNETYFPIINSRIWAARFLHQRIQTGHVQDDLAHDWISEIQKSDTTQLLLTVLEALPIFITHGKNLELKGHVIHYIDQYAENALKSNPLEWCLNFGVLSACKVSLYMQMREFDKAHAVREEMSKVSFLPSYSHYIEMISNQKLGHLS
jgi:hypothetical protein